MMIVKSPPLIEMDDALAICGRISESTMRNWIRKAKRNDRRFKGLPFHQVADKHPYRFDREKLILWWASLTNK